MTEGEVGGAYCFIVGLLAQSTLLPLSHLPYCYFYEQRIEPDVSLRANQSGIHQSWAARLGSLYQSN